MKRDSRESNVVVNVVVTGPKMVHYDVYTLIKIGIDRQG